MMYAEVVFNIAVPRSFTYQIPDNLIHLIRQGVLVLAPFGKRELTGLVVACSDRTGYADCKEIVDVVEDAPLVSASLLDLSSWIAEYYMCSQGQAVQLALPRGLDQKTIRKVFPVTPVPDSLEEVTGGPRHLYDIIFNEPGRDFRYYRRRFGTGSFYHAIHMLQEKALISVSQMRSAARVSTLFEKYIVVPDPVPENFTGLRESDRLRQLLAKHSGAEYALSAFQSLTGLSSGRIKTLKQRGIVSVIEREKVRGYQTAYREEKKDIFLNPEQKSALDRIGRSITSGRYGVFLLHGVTGSGKTQVYIEAIKMALKKGKTAIVLIPEISLTPQTVRRFENEFPDKVAVFHSRLTLGERYDTWRRIREGRYDIVVGPRSALFMPLDNTGIYIIDEEHDTSYKQDDPAPRYHARDVAIYFARKQNAVIVLGSATPSVESYYNALNGKYTLIELNQRINEIPMPEVVVVDMRQEGRRPGVLNTISPLLETKIRNALQNREQVIILQNRRGFATFLQCRDCGHIPLCPNCAIAYTFHAYKNLLQCHYCGNEQPAAQDCMRCGGKELQYKGVGTEKIEKELRQLFAGVRLLRMDLDTTGTKGAHDTMLQKFKSGAADILLGTQMIAKGLDFENVTVVGVVAAEVGLTLPDFRASERIFQLLTQVAGRAGRGDKKGTVVIQSFSDQFPAIRHARTHDYGGFYHQEVERRKKLDYPPFSRLILVRISASAAGSGLNTAKQVSQRLRAGSHRLFQVLGPAPAPFSRLKNMYHWHVLLKLDRDRDRNGVRSKERINDLIGTFLKPARTGIRVIIDVDPFDML
jgi:primosomal protein N' (replication factor Y)